MKPAAQVSEDKVFLKWKWARSAVVYRAASKTFTPAETKPEVMLP